MSLFSRLQSAIGFTRTEAQVLLFLTAAFLLGLGVKALREAGTPAAPPVPSYRAADSTFLVRSALPRDSAAPIHRVPPAKKKTPPGPGSIAVNAATREDLMRLPGIGPAYAERIVVYRAEHGPFRTLDELQNVKGIGPKTLARLRPFLRLH